MRCRAIRVLTALICLSGSSQALAEWQDWWQTPEQQAAEAFEQGDHERLLQQAPDAGWTGLGHYQAGDFDAAAETFAERAGQLQQQGDVKAANRALYNQGVSDVRAGRYDEALEHFETVLDSDPTFADAAFNRDIARQLKELQQQQQQPRQGDDGEPGDDDSGDDSEQNQQGESADQDSSGDQEQPSDTEASADGEQESGQDPSAEPQSDEQRAGESGESPEEGQESSGSQTGDEAPGESEAERQAAAEAARRALDAEAQQAEQEDATEGRFGAEEVDERPLSESEQAAEQLLRRIPDDPAGLLRRRLEQSHRNEYPEVRDGREAW